MKELEQAAFFQTSNGWITPKGEILACRFKAHIEEISAWPDIHTYLPKLKDDLAAIEEARKDCQDLEDREGHGEWHEYDITKDKAADRAIAALYDAKFLRLGRDFSSRSLAVEGSQVAITNQWGRLQKVLAAAQKLWGEDYRISTHIRRSEKEEKAIEAARKNASAKSLRTVQKQIKTHQPSDPILLEAYVPYFLNQSGKLTDEGKARIEQEKDEIAMMA